MQTECLKENYVTKELVYCFDKCVAYILLQWRTCVVYMAGQSNKTLNVSKCSKNLWLPELQLQIC